MTKKDRIANKSKKENGIYLQDNLIFAVTLLTRLSVATKIACTHVKVGRSHLHISHQLPDFRQNINHL